jgi:hypothetical protein
MHVRFNKQVFDILQICQGVHDYHTFKIVCARSFYVVDFRQVLRPVVGGPMGAGCQGSNIATLLKKSVDMSR